MNVTAKALTVTADNQTKVYGTQFNFTGAEFTTSGLTNGDSVTSVTLSSTGSPASASVGTYPITIGSATGTGLTNYAITYKTGTMTVVKATPTTIVSSNNNPSIFGQSVTFTSSVSPSTATGTVQFKVD